MADTTEQIDDGGPAFPSHPDSSYAGVPLWDWYAGQWLCGSSSTCSTAITDLDRATLLVREAFLIADAAIAERNRRNGQ